MEPVGYLTSLVPCDFVFLGPSLLREVTFPGEGFHHWFNKSHFFQGSLIEHTLCARHLGGGNRKNIGQITLRQRTLTANMKTQMCSSHKC